MIKNFRVYNEALALYQECQKLKAPHYIRDQLLRASLSILLNITEGAAKPSLRDKKRFYAIAYGSLRETQTLLLVLEHKELYEQANKLGAPLYCLVYK